MATKRSVKRLRQETERAVERGEQHRLTNILNDRVRKPRTFQPPSENAAKRQKLSHCANPPPASVLPPPIIPAPLPQHSTIQSSEQVESQKKKWRLSEILKKERDSKRMRQHAQPSFTLAPPHMDTRRPPTPVKKRSHPPSTTPSQKPKASPSKPKPNSAASLLAAEPVPSASRTAPIPGGDALLYDKSMLPKSYALILDTLIGLETAVSLLRLRKMRPTVGALRDIVARTTRRDFTLKALSQLAHIVPEIVAVLPGPRASLNPKKPSDSLIVRLDRPDDDGDESGKSNKREEDTRSSLGESCARLRRSLLHKRLLQRVREHHERFLERISETRYKGDVWHPDFDLEKEVSELPSPALYSDESSRAAVRRVKRVRFNIPDADGLKEDEDQNQTSPDEDEEDSSDGCIPKSLLERVRARSKLQREQESKQVEEKKSNESLLSKLPSTMDSIYIVMRNERRSAMGWSQLILKLEKLHPKKWGRDDLQKQVDAIVLLAPEWCKKVELKSSRGGHAFRVVSESAFNACREKVSSTKHHDFSVDQ